MDITALLKFPLEMSKVKILLIVTKLPLPLTTTNIPNMLDAHSSPEHRYMK